jgi:hypothetical protein
MRVYDATSVCTYVQISEDDEINTGSNFYIGPVIMIYIMVSSPNANVETGAMGGEIESRLGPMLWYFKYFRRKIRRKNWRFLHKTKRHFFAENWQKSQKIVIITSTPGHKCVALRETYFFHLESYLYKPSLPLDNFPICEKWFRYIIWMIRTKKRRKLDFVSQLFERHNEWIWEQGFWKEILIGKSCFPLHKCHIETFNQNEKWSNGLLTFKVLTSQSPTRNANKYVNMINRSHFGPEADHKWLHLQNWVIKRAKTLSVRQSFIFGNTHMCLNPHQNVVCIAFFFLILHIIINEAKQKTNFLIWKWFDNTCFITLGVHSIFFVR